MSDEMEIARQWLAKARNDLLEISPEVYESLLPPPEEPVEPPPELEAFIPGVEPSGE